MVKLSAKVVVLVPVAHRIEPDCESGLRSLEREGYEVRRVYGYAAIDQARNQLASEALRDGFDEIVWIDSDVAFDAGAVERLRSHELPICCGLYPKKGRRAFASNFRRGEKSVRFGRGGGLLEIDKCGFGFVHTRREIYEHIISKEGLPCCNEEFGKILWPFFMPMIVPSKVKGSLYLAEDFAFCERARRAGYKIMADTTIRLWHIGGYRYGWEDAGRDPDRFADYVYGIWKEGDTSSANPRSES